MSDLLSLVAFFVAMLAAHELAHCAVARAFGYKLICVGLSPFAVGVVFMDEPLMGYWVLQVAAPLVVTAGMLYQAFSSIPFLEGLAGTAIPADLSWRIGLALGLALLTSSGDICSMVTEARRPLRGKGRVVRDVRSLRQIGSLVLFTRWGRGYVAEHFGQTTGEFVRDVGLL